MATTTSTVASAVQLPDYAKQYVQDMLSKTQAYTDVNANPYQQYGGPRVAGFTDLQNQAFQNAGGMQPSQYGEQGAGIAGLAANQALQAGQGFTPGQFSTGTFDAQQAQQFMNPYMQDVVNTQQREAQRQADIATTQRNAQAVGAGAFGGSRQAIMDSEAARNLATQKGDIQAQGLNNAYQQAAAQFNTEQNRNLQAQQLGEQSRQYGAGIGLQGANTAMQGAATLGNIGQQQFGQNQAATNMQYGLGAAQQQNQQQQNDIGYQNFQSAINYPKDMLSFQSSMLRGLPMENKTQSTSTPDPSLLTQGLGIAAAAKGLGLWPSTAPAQTTPNPADVVAGSNPSLGSENLAKGGKVKQKANKYDYGGQIATPGIMGLMASKYART